jgi:hypothetical protein
METVERVIKELAKHIQEDAYAEHRYVKLDEDGRLVVCYEDGSQIKLFVWLGEED